MHGLVSQRRQVQNGQSSLGKSYGVTVLRRVNLFSAVIGASVIHGIVHCLKLFGCNGLFAKKSAYAAHGVYLRCLYNTAFSIK